MPTLILTRAEYSKIGTTVILNHAPPFHTLSHSLNLNVREWCYAQFSRDLPKLTPKDNHMHLDFENDLDAIHFKLKWL